MTLTIKNLINGEWAPSSTGDTLTSVNPANIGEVICTLPASGATDVDAAVVAAKAAYRKWRLVPAPKRGEILFRFGALVADPRVVTPLCGVLGTDRIALWTDKINLKRGREGSGFRWHQDSPYWSHVCGHCDRLPNCMITLDDADRENGCSRGSPRSGSSAAL